LEVNLECVFDRAEIERDPIFEDNDDGETSEKYKLLRKKLKRE
jgi:hypothetical protein